MKRSHFSLLLLFTVLCANCGNKSYNDDVNHNQSDKFYVSYADGKSYIHSTSCCTFANKNDHKWNNDKQVHTQDAFRYYSNPNNVICSICMSEEQKKYFINFATTPLPHKKTLEEETLENIEKTLQEKQYFNIIGQWKLNLGGGMGYDLLTLFYDNTENTFILESVSLSTSREPVEIIRISNQWEIKFKKKCDDYYILKSDGVIIMKNKDYPDVSTNCISNRIDDSCLLKYAK